ncbi:TetR/AcrR family transcriptional regulator [Microterricola viridarii]|uniref:DNA-binding transcriptional regulator, AcrR family n=1 Tax=Microterricola viridarii TaxID=412690 RepID=A0A1H1NSE4_9MICO|nr:TetR/AcrR family transcriptional regulator [Microterricola viridarii]SDS01877.1 DNA-binding transcriptional regulator, AcrR family [Microterricola viridarii]
MSSSDGAARARRPGSAPPGRRKDAQRNYDRLLLEARRVVAEQGSAASLEEIARRAELGIATLYRHFPNRTELLRALYEQALAEVEAAASDARAAPNAWQGLAGYVERLAAWLIEDPGLLPIIEHLGAAEPDYRPGGTLERPLAELIARAQAAGELRPDVDVADLARLITMLGGLSRGRGPAVARSWRRELGIVLDGLRAENVRNPLPGEPAG